MQMWLQSASKKPLMAFIIEALKVDQTDPETEWTGCRILGTVNRSNGYPVYSFQLFANKSKAKVYSGQCAPNVKGFGKKDKRNAVMSVAGWDGYGFERVYEECED
jgi:hypothetical protein